MRRDAVNYESRRRRRRLRDSDLPNCRTDQSTTAEVTRCARGDTISRLVADDFCRPPRSSADPADGPSDGAESLSSITIYPWPVNCE